MIQIGSASFKEVWFFDFEFRSQPGERPDPICLVAVEMGSGRRVAVWRDELLQMATPPYDVGPDNLFVAYYASAEVGCHLALGWPAPANVLDLFVEFRNATNGSDRTGGNGLLGALTYYGLDAMAGVEKEEMRQLALRGGPWTREERAALLEYCGTDSTALARLLPHMLPAIDLDRALIRGRFMVSVARMEHYGIPIDAETLGLIRENWDDIKRDVIRRIDADFGIFDDLTFKTDRFAAWLAAREIPWPATETGRLALDDDTFKDMSKAYPIIAPLRELRGELSQFRLNSLAVGPDGRNRVLLSPFGANSSRNTPSNSKFVFGPATWVRSLIKPAPGWGIAYVDWSQQEFAIAAALSKDQNMIRAYLSGDPYLEFAIQAGAAPPGATKASHGEVRELYKQCVLGTQYGLEAEGLAARIGKPVYVAKELLRAHKRTFATYWAWSQSVADAASLNSELYTTFGWTRRVGRDANERSLRNFPMQANGAEMMRLACIIATERGIRVCAPIHDALLIEAPIGELGAHVAATQESMRRAGELVLDGFQVGSDAKVVTYPDRYSDKRGQEMWESVMAALATQTVLSAL